MMTITDRFDEVKKRIADSAREAGRDPGDVLLLAVSKTFPVESIQALYEHGVRDFGESRVAELSAKAAVLPADVRWHFIGRLQANKVRKIVQLAEVIHSVDSIELLQRVDRIAGEEGKCPRVLLEVSVSGEESKGGVSLTAMTDLAAVAADCKNIRFDGFMTMAPLGADAFYVAALFEMLKLRRDEEAGRLKISLPILSMGMSNDFEIAVRHGSTLVRVGSAIFGAR